MGRLTIERNPKTEYSTKSSKKFVGEKKEQNSVDKITTSSKTKSSSAGN